MMFFPPRKSHPWMIVAILWVIAMLNYLDRLMLTTMGDSIKVATWEHASPLPDKLGVAAPFAGVSSNALLVAGGANFPNGKPWEGGKKVWHDEIYILEEPGGTWIKAGRLPHALAYGVSASFKEGVVCVGGSDSDRHHAEAFILQWNPHQHIVEVQSLPPLPQPLANACGAVVGTTLTVAGGETAIGATMASTNVWTLNLENPAEGWAQRASYPGPARTLAGVASAAGRFYLTGGAELMAGPDGKQKRRAYLKDTCAFDLRSGDWTRVADMPRPLAGMPSPAAPSGDSAFMFYGGDDGSEQALPPEQRTGFSRNVIKYDSQKDTWSEVGTLPEAARVTTPLVVWRGCNVVPSGEIRAAVRSPVVSYPMTNAHFGLLTSVFLWVYALFSPFGGYLADRYSRSKVILFSLFVWSTVTWLTGHTHSLTQLLMARSIMGISEAFYIPAALALIADYHQGKTRSLATGIHMSGLYAGAAMGGLGGVVAELFGWRSSFTIFGFAGIAYALIIFFPLRDAPRESNAGKAGDEGGERPPVSLSAAIRDLLSRGSFLFLLAYNSLLAIAFWGINGWLPTYLQEHFHLGQGAAGMNATFYVQFASFIGILLGGFFADRWSRTNVRGRILIPAIGFIVAAPFLFLSASTAVLGVAIGGLMMFGLARGFSDANLMPILCQVSDPRYRATGYGILNLFGCVTGGIMIYVGGALKDHQIDLSSVFKFAAIGLLAAGCLLFLVKPRRDAETIQS